MTYLCLLAGCQSYTVTTDEKTRQEIADLHQAVAAFKAHFGLDAMPSRIRLASKPAEMDAESIAIIQKMFPDRDFQDTWARKGIVWNDQAAGPVTLEGDQCLVFFLGGPLRGGVPQGWSLNPKDPSESGENRRFFEFDSKRLKRRAGQAYPSFLDPYGQQPYAYFASPFRNTDCQTLGVQPYGRGQNGQTYQIISAGPDGRFGMKGADWSSTNSALTYPKGSDGADDWANFHTRPLGVPE